MFSTTIDQHSTIRNTYRKTSIRGFTSGADVVGYESSEGNKHSRPTHNTHNTMNKLTTERFDAQHCTVLINSSELTIKNESHRIEIRYLDENDILAAVCSYIEQRHWDRNAEDKQHKLLRAMARLDERIQAAKAEAKA